MNNLAEEIARRFINESKDLLDASMVKIEHCIKQLDDKQLWWRPQESMNSIGNLVLHLEGNLRQWGIVGVRQLTDERERESEFAQRDIIESETVMEKLRQTVAEAKATFEDLDPDSLPSERVIQGFETTVLGAMTHTCSHFVGHAHQIIHLARLQLGESYEFQWAPDADRKKLPI